MTHAHDHAIGRRALDREMPLAHFAQSQRIVERQRMRHARLIGLRRHDPDVVRQSARDCLAGIEARRMDAVVIGDEDTQSRPLDCRQPRHVRLERFRHCDRAVVLLIGFHHRDQRAADRDAEPLSVCTGRTPSLAR